MQMLSKTQIVPGSDEGETIPKPQNKSRLSID